MGAQSADMPGFLKGDFTHTMQSTNSTRFHNGKKVLKLVKDRFFHLINLD